jgi:hypothetical protein
MSKARDEVEIIPPKGDGFGGKTTPIDGTPRARMWSNSPPSSSNSCSNGRLTSSRSPKAENWLFPLHQMKIPMLHLKKKSMARKEDKKSYNTTSFNYDNLPSSSTFTSVHVGKAPVLMGQAIPNGDTR